MCGIYGQFASQKGLTDSDIDYMPEAMQRMAHRGPDDEGTWFDQEHCLRFSAFVDSRSLSNRTSADVQPRWPVRTHL